MIRLTSQTQFDSKVYPDADPPVKFVIRRYSEGLRHALALEAAQFARELNEVEQDLQPMLNRYRTEHKDRPIEQWPNPPLEVVELMSRKQSIVDSIHHVWIRKGFIGAEGIELDGKSLTADSLIESADPAFYQEVKAALLGEYGLTEKNAKASASPLPSSDPGDSSNSLTSADTANVSPSTDPEIAADTSPAT